jgi:hypothetical protein
MTFDLYVGIDYSGRSTPTQRTKYLQVYSAASRKEPQRVSSPTATPKKHHQWHRQEIADWLVGLCDQKHRFLAGIDHAFSFPVSYFDRYRLTSWAVFIHDFCKHWPTDRTDATVQSLRPKNPRIGTSDEFRLTEKWTSSAKSVFLFDVQGSVAKSTHAGIPWLRYIRQQARGKLHFWPFDGWEVPEGKSVVAEVYPSIFRNRYPRLEGAVERTPDQQDAYAVARWLEATSRRGFLPRYLSPPLTSKERQLAKREGWILGVA